MHIHHIIPKHMGGSDDPQNLIELSVEDHALAHKKLWEEHRKIEDYAAWKGLLGQIGKEEIFLLTSKIGGERNKGVEKSEDHKKKISESLIKKYKEDQSYAERISDSMKGNSNSKNHSSDAYRNKQSQAMKEAWARRKQK